MPTPRFKIGDDIYYRNIVKPVRVKKIIKCSKSWYPCTYDCDGFWYVVDDSERTSKWCGNAFVHPTLYKNIL